MDKNEIFEMVITEMTECALMEYRKNCGEENQRYKELGELSLLRQEILEKLSPEDRQVLEECFVKNSLIADYECHHLYMQGAKDCVDMLKKLGAL